MINSSNCVRLCTTAADKAFKKGWQGKKTGSETHRFVRYYRFCRSAGLGNKVLLHIFRNLHTYYPIDEAILFPGDYKRGPSHDNSKEASSIPRTSNPNPIT